MRQARAQAPSQPRPSLALPRDVEVEIVPATLQQTWEFLGSPQRAANINLAIGWRVRSTFDAMSAQRTIDEIVRRHDVLRSFLTSVDDRVIQAVLPHVETPLVVIDLRQYPAARRGRALSRYVKEGVLESFDLRHPGHLRPSAHILGSSEWVLLLIVSHTIWDSWSTHVFIREFAHHYDAFVTGGQPALDELPVQLGDVAEWDLQRSLTKRFPTSPAATVDATSEADWPIDQRSVETKGSLMTAVVAPLVRRSAVASLESVGRRLGATPMMGFLSVYAVLLWVYSRRNRLVIGVQDANREGPEKRGLIGCLAETKQVTIDVGGHDVFSSIVRRARDAVLEMYDSGVTMRDAFGNPTHEDEAGAACATGFAYLPPDYSQGNAIIDVALEHHPYVAPRWWRTFNARTIWDFAYFDFNVLSMGHGSVYGRLAYNAYAFTRPFMQAFATDYSRLVRLVARDPERTTTDLATRLSDIRCVRPDFDFLWATPDVGILE